MTEEETQTQTKFIGDIVFNNGEKDVKVSELVSKSELTNYVKQDALATTLNDYVKTDDYIKQIMRTYEDLEILHDMMCDYIIEAKFGDKLILELEYDGVKTTFEGVCGEDGQTEFVTVDSSGNDITFYYQTDIWLNGYSTYGISVDDYKLISAKRVINSNKMGQGEGLERWLSC